MHAALRTIRQDIAHIAQQPQYDFCVIALTVIQPMLTDSGRDVNSCLSLKQSKMFKLFELIRITVKYAFRFCVQCGRKCVQQLKKMWSPVLGGFSKETKKNCTYSCTQAI